MQHNGILTTIKIFNTPIDLLKHLSPTYLLATWSNALKQNGDEIFIIELNNQT